MQWANILIGATLLLFGRRLFWLFVGGMGFLVGFNFAGEWLRGQPDSLILLIAIGVGLVGAIASIFLQRVVVAIAGFLAGGYFLSAAAMVALHDNAASVSWIAFLLGGIVGAILTAMLLDPALILLSSLAGATAISQNVPLEPPGKGILFVALLVLGIILQTKHLARLKNPPPSEQAK